MRRWAAKGAGVRETAIRAAHDYDQEVSSPPDRTDRSLHRGPGPELYERVPLSGKLSLPSGDRVEAALSRSPHGAFVIPAKGGVEGALALEGQLVYERGLVQDRLAVAGQTFTVLAARRRAARELIALARLAHPDRTHRVFAQSVTVARPTTLGAAWLTAELDDDEELLVWLPLPEREPLSVLGGEREPADVFLLVTDRRAATVALGELGDVQVIRIDEGRSPHPSSDGALLTACLTLTDDDPSSWPWRVAALNWRHKDKHPAYRARAAFLLHSLLASGHVLGPLTGFFLGGALGLSDPPSIEDVEAALATLTRPRELAEWWRAFELPVDAGMLLIERARALELRAAVTLPLHEVIWERTGRQDDALEAARADLELAAHYEEAGRKADAEELVRTRLDELPAVKVDDFLPRVRTGLNDIRCRALSQWADVSEHSKTRALTKLVQRAPLSSSSSARLAREGRGWAAEAAGHVQALLAPGGLSAPAEERPAFKAHRLEPEQVVALEHPAGRRSSTLGALQAYLAIAQEPDRTSLRAFCERLSDTDYPVATAALADAVHMLGAPTIDAFVSRGEKGIGIRAYEGNPPFLLVGGHHLADDGPFTLGPRELRFAICAEVAHVRFKHRRMTPGEVWTGAWEKSRAGLDLLFTLLPAFKGWEIAEKLVKAVTLTRKAVGTVDKAARKKIREETVGVRLSDLVEAHRLMQLTADRAGLLLAGDLKSAIRAMFLLDPTLRAELPIIEHHGLAASLLRTDDEGALIAPDLLIRTAALIGFYVSGTWVRLSAAAQGLPSPAGETPASTSSVS